MFRTRKKSKFPVETGSWNSELNTKGTIGDEFHYLLECDFFAEFRRKVLYRNLFISPPVLKFKRCNEPFTLLC